MTVEEKKEIASLLMLRAELAGKVFSPQAISLMIQDLEGLNGDEIILVLKSWGKTQTGFPFPSEIRNKIIPEISDRDNAVDVANIIISCVSKFGYTNEARAKNEMGELAWATAIRMGGWKHLCETMTHENENIFRAQIRDYAETISKKSKAGRLLETPNLPVNEEVKQIINKINFLE